MSYEEMNEARKVMIDLRRSLHNRYQRDTEAEVSVHDLRTIDAAVKMAAEHVGDHPVIAEMRELFSPEFVAGGQSIRVEEILTNVDLLTGVMNRATNEMGEPGATRRRRAH